MESDDTPDALAHELKRAAADVEVGEAPTMLSTVQGIATRRHRRRNVVVGLAAAATLIVSGAVVAQFMSGDTGDDMIVSAPVTEPADTEPADTEPVGTEPSDLESSPTTAVSSEPGSVAAPAVVADPSASNQVIPSAVSIATDPGQSPDDGTGQNEVFPWKDGVLSIRTTSPPQALPDELPTDIADAFPPEVRELFPDGLPPTISEAIDVLSEAGLLDEVTQILADNAEVSDAIYSQPTEAPTRTVRYSPDGVEWTDIDASFPPGGGIWSGAVSTGERFVFARNVVSTDTPSDDAATDGRRPPVPDAIEIHSSTNLVDWSVQTIDTPGRPGDVDPAFPYEVYSHGLAATDSGFVITVEAMVYVDFAELLDPELRDRVYSGGASTSQGSDGVTVDLYETSGAEGPGDPGQVVETFTFTWADLGLSGPPPADGANTMTRYAGTWDGGPAVASDIDVGWSDVRAVGDMFVEVGPSARRSADGMEWLPFESPGGEYIEAIVETDTGVAVRDSDGRGNSATYVGDIDGGDWTPVDTPELPDQVYPEISGPGAFLLADQGGGEFDPYADAVATRERAEVDGYLYEMENDWEGGSGDDILTYRLTDLASGEVVVSETSDGGSGSGQPFDFIDYRSGFGDGFHILDPESGEPLVTIPYAAVTQEIVNADGSVTDPTTFEPPEAMMDMGPDYWLMASLDGGWVVQQLETDAAQGGYPTSVVALGDMALVALADGTILRVTSA